MTKNPFINGLTATTYIVVIAAIMTIGSKTMANTGNSFMIPVAMISLFTLSAAIMGYLFLFQPGQLYFDGKKKQAIKLFLQTVASFGLITAIIFFLLFTNIIPS